MMLVVIFIVFGVLVVVKAARQMLVILLFPRMAVYKSVGMFVLVFVQMVMDRLAMPVGVDMQVPVQMVVFMLMLQPMDGVAAALTISISQPVEAAQAFILQKNVAGNIFQNAALVHHQCAAGQLSDKKHIVADQQEGHVQIPQDLQ